MLYKRKYISAKLKNIKVKYNRLLDLAVKYDRLISPEQMYYELLPCEKYTESKELLYKIIQHSTRSIYIQNVYDADDLFLEFCDIFASKTHNSVYIIEFDIKGCTKLASKLSSDDIYKIKAFIFSKLLVELREKTHSGSIYAFDYVKNDDGVIIINSELDINVIRTYLIECENNITETLCDVFNLSEYSAACILGICITRLGQKKKIIDLYAAFEDKINIRLNSTGKYIFEDMLYDGYKYDIYTDLFHIANQNIRYILTNLFFRCDDFGGSHCLSERSIFIPEIQQKYKELLHIKFDNFSGLNNLTGNKIYGHRIFRKLVTILYQIVKPYGGKVYFVGLNSVVVTLEHGIELNEFTNALTYKITKKINKFKISSFFYPAITNISKNLRFKDLYSHKGYPQGFSFSRLYTTPVQKIKNTQDFVKFKQKTYKG